MLESLKSAYTDFILRLENAVNVGRISTYYKLFDIVLENIAVGEERGRKVKKFDTARCLRKMSLSDNVFHYL